MGKYYGSLEELKSIQNQHGLKGTWSVTPNAHKFTSIDGGILLWYEGTKTLQCQGKTNSRQGIESLIKQIEDGVPSDGSTTSNISVQRQTAFIVYGHDETSRDQLELILTKLDIKHVILAKLSGDGKTIIEALETHIGQDGSAKVGIVLLTPDDMGYAKREGPESLKERARQNVILEMGMLIARLGRLNTIILVKGKVERPSDTDGIIYLSFKTHVRESATDLVKRLGSCGFEIDHKKLLNL